MKCSARSILQVLANVPDWLDVIPDPWLELGIWDCRTARIVARTSRAMCFPTSCHLRRCVARSNRARHHASGSEQPACRRRGSFFQRTAGRIGFCHETAGLGSCKCAVTCMSQNSNVQWLRRFRGCAGQPISVVRRCWGRTVIAGKTRSFLNA